MVWENIYSNKLGGSYLKYPSDAFVSIFFKSLKFIENKKNCLDFGCGSGNNSEVVKDFFENMYLVDISETALDIASNRLNIDKSNCSTTIKSNYKQLDFIFAWQVLYYNDSDSLIKIINNFYNNMNTGGVVMCSIITTTDCKVKLSNKISDNEYIITDKIPHQAGVKIYACETIDEFIALFEKKFKILDYGKFCRKSYLKNDDEIDEWYFVGKKV